MSNQPSAKVVAKAHGLLTAGRVRVVEYGPDRGHFEVQGSAEEPYDVKVLRGVWACTCPAKLECAHLVAVKLVASGQPPLTVELGTRDPDLDALLDF